jgi:RNA 2',3'-cyclic 3'-phosphodiesterase
MTSGDDLISWRVFCAIELPIEVKNKIQSHNDRLRKSASASSASWTRVGNIHLTLKFFGQVERGRISQISTASDRAVAEFAPFEISVGGVGVFPKPSHPRVLWVGIVDESQELARLQALLENECLKEGFATEDRSFRPHLTIARIKKQEGARSLAEAHLGSTFETVGILVRELVVFRSELGREGSKYTAISRHNLSE